MTINDVHLYGVVRYSPIQVHTVLTQQSPQDGNNFILRVSLHIGVYMKISIHVKRKKSKVKQQETHASITVSVSSIRGSSPPVVPGHVITIPYHNTYGKIANNCFLRFFFSSSFRVLVFLSFLSSSFLVSSFFLVVMDCLYIAERV